ncbi:hypothetical protein ACK3SF_03005 [Candidatus Nanosalina sp. VS9-1]|uniref:DUF7260 family protein n=1 Tax=Candidatus Nanosalina sp. VS9-1 TaxID=3388566 RepID=UPI0039E0A322
MSNPAQEYTEKAFETVEEAIRDLEDDIDSLQDFREKVLSQPVQNGGGRQMLSSKAGNKVIDIYSEEFFNRENSKDRISIFASEYDLSLPAADLFDELANVPDIDDGSALQFIKHLDNGAQFNEVVKGQFEKLSKYPAKLREHIVQDAKVERDSLRNYMHDIKEVKDTLYELNEENPLPVDLDDAVDLVGELEGLQSRVQQLKNRRLHELRRRDDIQQGYFDSQEAAVYEDEEFGRPVLQELQYVDDALEEAYDNLVVDF